MPSFTGVSFSSNQILELVSSKFPCQVPEMVIEMSYAAVDHQKLMICFWLLDSNYDLVQQQLFVGSHFGLLSS